MNTRNSTREIRDLLETERRSILATLPQVAQEVEKSITANPDRADLARQYDLHQRSSSWEDLAMEKLERIQKAIGRLDAGIYGKCIKCGEEIQAARLQALPYAEYCISCQQRQEA